MNRRKSRGSACRICGKSGAAGTSGVCDECSEYGAWWDQVARRPAMEVTGEIGVAELARLVEQDEGRVRIMLNTEEATSGHRVFRYLNRGPDLLPVVVSVTEGEVGLSIRYRDRYGNNGELWRAKRMETDVVVDGLQPLRVVD